MHTQVVNKPILTIKFKYMRIFTPINTRYIFNILRKISFLLFITFSAQQVKAEGTKQINPSSTDQTTLNINRASGVNIPFASWDCAPDYRLNINICKPNEKIYMGFKASSNKIYFRLKDPSGTVIMGPTLIPSSAAAGYTANYAQAVAGPSQLGIAGGYNAIVYNNPSGLTGDFSVEFNYGNGSSLNGTEIDITLFDITVADGPAAANIQLGRLWSKDWQLNTQSYSNRCNGTMYVYSTDGIVTNINFNGMQPYKYAIACNSKGTVNTGNFASDRMSVVGNQTFPEYKIFLNNPDLNCYPTGTFGNINGAITVSGCAPNYCININIKDRAGDIGIVLDLNGTAGYQANSKDVAISFKASIGDNCIPWDGKDGLGNTVASGTNFNVQVDFFNGITNLPLYDGEINDQGFIVNLVRPSGPAPKLFWDDINIKAGTAIDGLQNFNGCTTTGTTGCHRWTDRGDNNCSVECPETINTWWYANIQTKNITFNSVVVDVDADASSPGKGAGNAKTVCGDGSGIVLNGSKLGPDATTWSTNGTGTFSNTSTLNPTYTPSTADLANGSVKLTIKTSGASCPTASDFIPITLQPVPKVNAGGTINVCENSPNAQLAGTTANGVTGIQWTGGNGSYAPNNTTLNAVYTPNAAEIAAGTVTLILTSTTGNGVCSAATGSVTINITKSPIVDAGTSTTLCANNPVVTLAGNLGNGAINPKWTGGAGTFSNTTNVNTTYTPTAGEISAGSVTLNLTADKANCNSVTKNIVITFTAAPTVNAGPDQSLCENNSLATLKGTSSATVLWTGGTGTFTPDRSTKNAKYQATAAEIASGSVSLTLTTVAGGGCSSVASSPMVISYVKKPVVDAGPDLNSCSNKPSTNLTGKVTGATGGIWSGFGGSFTPSNTSLTTSYLATPAEIGDGTGGFTFLILTSTGNGKCLAVSDTVNVVFDPNPTADAGPDVKICKNNLTVQLAGATENNTTQTWTTSGTGTFNNVNILNAIYTPSQADTAGNVILTLKSNRPSCNEVSDPMIVSFVNKPKSKCRR